MSDKLHELTNLLKGHRVFIQTHNFPDPDAIASAFGLQVLLEQFQINATICHHGKIERAATLNMVSEFGIKMVCDNDIDYMMEEDYIITVDCQKGNANILDLIGDEVAVFDHHPVFTNSESYKFKDIRLVGSCASIIADYFRQYNLDMPEEVATALLYGLKCDTRDFTRGVTQLDVEIYSYLFPKSNNAIVRRLQSGQIEYEELAAFVDSMSNIDVLDDIAFANLDFSCTEAFMATVSDFILSIDAVSFAVVYSRREGGFKFSVRSELDELPAGIIVSNALAGIGSGGGHALMAGGFAPENAILDISIDFNKVIQNLFLNEIRKFREK